MFQKNLKFYRLKKRLSKKALADACSVTPMAITHYEAGDRKPNMQVLEAIAAALDVRMSDLLKRRNARLAFCHGEFRKSDSLGKAEQGFVRESVEEYFGRFYDAVEVLGGDVLPAAPKCGCLKLGENAEVDAAALRKNLGFSSVGPVYDFIKALEDRGFLVMSLPMENRAFSGMSGFVEGRPYIVLNSLASLEHGRSTIAHELAHLMFSWPEDLKGKALEARVAAIGGAFLLPAADLRRELGLHRSSFTNDMALVAHDYGVSVKLLGKRANAAGIISDSALRSLLSSSSNAQESESIQLRVSSEQPVFFDRLVCRAVCENDISVQRGAELLNVEYVDLAAECAPFKA